MSRLTIDITEEQHQALKVMAALAGKSIKQFTLERLFAPGSANEAAQELKALLADRVAEADRGEYAQGGISEIAEKALRAATGE